MITARATSGASASARPSYDISSVAGAAGYDDDCTGRAKNVIDEDREVIVGATSVGTDITELLQSATIAVVGENRLRHAVPPHPTVSGAWLRLLETDAAR